jgi:two-component system, OmpR family, alkaline phosphatase synthesis response regulator PhoP
MAMIHILDDDEEFTHLIQSSLEASGHIVLTARTGHEGVALLKDEKPDVYVLNIVMSDMDGYAYLLAIREGNQFPCKVIAYGRGAASIDLNDALDLGVDATFKNPFDNKDFIDKILELVG